MRKPVTIILAAILAAAILLLIPGCSGTVPLPRVVKGSGDVITRERSFSDFTYVEIGSAFEVEVTKSGSYLVSITADDNLFEYIEVSMEDETLKILLTPGYNYSGATLKAGITMPELSGLRLYGATKGMLTGFKSSNALDLELAGASSLDMDIITGDTTLRMSGATGVTGKLNARYTEFEILEASRIELAGSANKMNLRASGASKLDLADFPLDQASVTLSGASETTIKVNGKLDVALTGASRLYYDGNPVIGDITISEASTIKRK